PQGFPSCPAHSEQSTCPRPRHSHRLAWTDCATTRSDVEPPEPVTVTESPGATARRACRSTFEVSTVSDRPSDVRSLRSDMPMDSTTPSSDCAAGTLADGEVWPPAGGELWPPPDGEPPGADGKLCPLSLDELWPVVAEGALFSLPLPGWIQTPTISCFVPCS